MNPNFVTRNQNDQIRFLITHPSYLSVAVLPADRQHLFVQFSSQISLFGYRERGERKSKKIRRENQRENKNRNKPPTLQTASL